MEYHFRSSKQSVLVALSCYKYIYHSFMDVQLYRRSWKWACNNRNMRTMHFVGIGGGVSITLFAALARAVLTTMELNADGSCSLTMKELYTTDKGKGRKWRARYALGMALLSALAALGFLVAFIIVLADPEEAADMHLCILYDSRAACHGELVPERWYNLTVAELGAWPCEWDDAALVTESPCVNPKCEDDDVLHDNQLRIVCEFHLLLFWIVTLLCTVMLMEDAEVWTPIAQGAENWGSKDSPGRPGDGAGGTRQRASCLLPAQTAEATRRLCVRGVGRRCPAPHGPNEPNCMLIAY